jgi:hypothetical protein
MSEKTSRWSELVIVDDPFAEKDQTPEQLAAAQKWYDDVQARIKAGGQVVFLPSRTHDIDLPPKEDKDEK